MARTALTSASVTRTGIIRTVPAAADQANGNVVPNDGQVWIEATNSDTNPHTVTITPTATDDGLAVSARTVSLAASAVKLVGPFPVDPYGPQLHLDVDSATVKFAAYRLGA